MFVGKSGSRKTGAIGSFPEPIKILNFDGKDRLQPLLLLYPKKDIHYEDLSYKDVPKIDSELDKIIKNPKAFATYAVDSFTFFMQHAIKYAMKNQPSKKKVGEVPLMEIEHFNVESAAAANLYDLIQTISGCHFILTAHYVETSQKVLGRENPIISKKLCTAGKNPAAMMPGCFSEVYSFHLEASSKVGADPKPFIITRSGSEEDVDTLEKTALPLPSRLDYGKDLYSTLKTELAKSALVLK